MSALCDDTKLVAYLVLSNIIKPNGCDLWMSPEGGEEEIVNFYAPEGQAYVILKISGLGDDELRALTERRADTSLDSERMYALFLGAIERAYQAGLAGSDSPPPFTWQLPCDTSLQGGIDKLVAAAYAQGVLRKQTTS